MHVTEYGNACHRMCECMSLNICEYMSPNICECMSLNVPLCAAEYIPHVTHVQWCTKEICHLCKVIKWHCELFCGCSGKMYVRVYTILAHSLCHYVVQWKDVHM